MYDQIGSNKFKSALLIAFFVLLVLAVGWAFGYATEWGPAGLILALGFAFVMTWTSYWYSDKIVLSMSRARPVSREQEPHLYHSVEGLAIAAGIPTPTCYVIDDPAPNAFATGRNPEHAALAVTSGLLQRLDRLELEGVIGHEMAHIKNYDTLVQTLAAVMAGTIVLLSDWMFRAWFWGGGRKRGNDSNMGGLGAILAVVAVALLILSPFFAAIIQMAISRKREYLADANGALITRYPQGLADALKKIAADNNQLRSANKATESMYIYNPLKDIRGGKGLNSLFDTHPPVAERIQRLEAM